MTGIIILWWGAIPDIPPGWHLCDGADGTIDLRNRVVVSAGLMVPVGSAGGSITHTHNFTSDDHYHPFLVGVLMGAGSTYAPDTTWDPVTGTTDAGSSLPPYHVLAYIQKMAA